MLNLRSTKNFAAVVLGLGLMSGCQTGSTSLLSSTFEAHGGLQQWRNQRTFHYTLNGFPLTPQVAKPNQSTVDLRTRRNRIEGVGFTVGFDGQQAWVSPGPYAVGLSARFVSLGSFYFIGMPFVFADEGVVLSDGGTATFRGQPYDVVKVGYDRGVGHTSQDDYVVFIHPATKRLALINHSVTENPDIERVTWVFDEWQKIEGLQVPARMTFYGGWNPDDPGQGASFTIEQASFSRRAPDPAIYAAPQNAVIDDSPDLH